MVLLSLRSALYPAGRLAAILSGPFQYVSRSVSMYCAGCPVTFSNAAASLRYSTCSMADFEFHAVRALGMVEQPTCVVSAIVKRDVGHRAVAERHAPGHDAIFHGRRHGRHGRDRHLHVRARGEYRGAHPVPIRLVLEQDPFADAAFAVIVAGAESRVVTGFLEGVVQIAVNEEFDPFFDRYLVTADSPVISVFSPVLNPSILT